MKIGILTQPLGHNYGGVLQNWALQQVLIDLGHDPLTINLRGSSEITLKYKIKSKVALVRNKAVDLLLCQSPKKDLLHLRNSPDLHTFVNKNIRISEHIQAPLHSKSLDKYDLDAIIVGSDQVWRPSYSPCIKNFFLDFLSENKKIIKIAYAASLGNSINEFSPKLKMECTELLEQFNAVSVRELSSIEVCQKHFNVTPVCALDPTMLLNEGVYRDLVNRAKIPAIAKSYGLCYFLDPTVQKNNVFLEECQKRSITPISLIPINPPVKSELLAPTAYPQVEKWLKAMMNADFIMTDSFHGTAFSIIFNKEFSVINNAARGADRIASLLENLNIESTNSIYKSDDSIKSLINKFVISSVEIIKNEI